MNIRPTLRTSLIAAALAATAATAWAAYDSRNSTLVPAPGYAYGTTLEERPLAREVPVVVANEQGLAPNEELVAPVEARRPVSEPAITVEERRLSVDQRIQADVIDLLARNPALSGRIGVVSENAVVTLTGHTTTSGMAWRAARDARGVIGVRQVVNEIRPRLGGITS